MRSFPLSGFGNSMEMGHIQRPPRRFLVSPHMFIIRMPPAEDRRARFLSGMTRLAQNTDRTGRDGRSRLGDDRPRERARGVRFHPGALRDDMVIPLYDLQSEGAREESSGEEGLISIKLPEPLRPFSSSRRPRPSRRSLRRRPAHRRRPSRRRRSCLRRPCGPPRAPSEPPWAGP